MRSEADECARIRRALHAKRIDAETLHRLVVLVSFVPGPGSL
jgi:hypothetical protein